MDALQIRTACRLTTNPEELNRLIISSQLRNIEIFKSYNGSPIAYICFAEVGARTLRMIAFNKGKIVDNSEWCSGKLLYITDFCISNSERSLAISLIKTYLKSKKFYSYFRNNLMKTYYKRKYARIINNNSILQSRN